jgi:carboxymethylenebutenolidase
MKRLLCCLLPFTGCLLAVALIAQAQDPVKDRLDKSSRHHEWVKIKTKDGREVSAWVVYPEVSKPATAVVMIHEIFGLSEWVRSAADQMAEAGYIAIAPDLLSQMGPGGKGSDGFKGGEVMKAIRDLPQRQVWSDLDATVTYARGLKSCNKKVAVGGFCWGGGQSFSYATHNPDIAAAFVFYGPAPKSDALKNIKVPVYGFYGGNDNRITGAVPDVAKEMKELGKKFEPVTYEGAGHGFMRAGETAKSGSANRKARDEAWQRWKGILKSL